MKRYTIKLDRRQPIVIETPLGFITIEKGRQQHLILDMPEKMVPRRTAERAAEHARFIEDGRPLYDLLEPVLDDTGRVVDLLVKRAVRIEPGDEDAAQRPPLTLARPVEESGRLAAEG